LENTALSRIKKRTSLCCPR